MAPGLNYVWDLKLAKMFTLNNSVAIYVRIYQCQQVRDSFYKGNNKALRDHSQVIETHLEDVGLSMLSAYPTTANYLSPSRPKLSVTMRPTLTAPSLPL